MMAIYALVKDGVVENTVIWDGEGDLFPDYQAVELNENETAGPGWSYDGKNFTAPETVQTPEELAATNLAKAQSEYEIASAKIIALNEQIADEDYAGTTEEAVRTELESWTGYRKQLRAYIKAADFSDIPPSM